MHMYNGLFEFFHIVNLSRFSLCGHKSLRYEWYLCLV